jgi:Tol biopolymer transport system component
MPEDSKKTDLPDDNFLDDAMSDVVQTSARSIPVRDKPRGLKAKVEDLWKNPKKRKMLIASIACAVLILFAVPHSRYFVLNNIGVRSSASIKILDQSTGQPLKNVSVKLRDQQATTDNTGVAKLNHLKLGQSKLEIQKRAFAVNEKNITVGWGSNPLGDLQIKPVGLQYSFDVSDFLSGKPIDKVEALSGEFSAFSNSEGRVVLTIEDPGEEAVEITIKAKNYRDEVIIQSTENKSAQKISMVPDRKHLFVSKRSGKYDVYKIDVDGKNEQLVMSGTGNEREDMTLVSHSNKDIAVLVSTRENVRNRDGFLLSTITLIDMTSDGVQTSSLGTSEKVQIVGWSGDYLVYVKIGAGESAESPDRHRLVTYNYETGESKEIAKSNFFNDVLLVDDAIYYAPSNAYQTVQTGLYKVKANGENNTKIFDQEVWNIFRIDYNTINFSVNEDWYEFSVDDGRVLALSGPPPVQVTRIYLDNLNKQQSLWIDQRDGKGALIAYDTGKKEERTVISQSGLVYPARWMNDTTIVYRISTDQEIADYVINLEGGEAKKIKDVTNTGGVDRWYFY